VEKVPAGPSITESGKFFSAPTVIVKVFKALQAGRDGKREMVLRGERIAARAHIENK
jgi:hypothetical protein